MRTWRQASPAVVRREPGYCTCDWISTPFSAPGSEAVAGLLAGIARRARTARCCRAGRGALVSRPGGACGTASAAADAASGCGGGCASAAAARPPRPPTAGAQADRLMALRAGGGCRSRIRLAPAGHAGARIRSGAGRWRDAFCAGGLVAGVTGHQPAATGLPLPGRRRQGLDFAFLVCALRSRQQQAQTGGQHRAERTTRRSGLAMRARFVGAPALGLP